MLFTASGNTMESLGEVKLEIKIGKLHSPQGITITPSLITDCILGVDFLARHRINLDFINRVATGPNLGIIKSLDSQDSSEHLNHSCPIHDEQKCPESYAVLRSPNQEVEGDRESLGAVPRYDCSPLIEYPDTEKEFSGMILKFQDLFVSVPGVAKVDPFLIRTGNAAPVKVPTRMIPQAYQQEMKSQIGEMLTKGVIQVSSSPWLAPPVLVQKKVGSIQFCIDYRNLNKVTQKDAYPLPLPDQVQDKLCGMKYFTKLDLNSGYRQISIIEMDLEKTAFSPVPGMGLSEFKVLPFGLTGGPSNFRKIMDQVLCGLEYCKDISIDDIPIFSPDLESHRQDFSTAS